MSPQLRAEEHRFFVEHLPHEEEGEGGVDAGGEEHHAQHAQGNASPLAVDGTPSAILEMGTQAHAMSNSAPA